MHFDGCSLRHSRGKKSLNRDRKRKLSIW